MTRSFGVLAVAFALLIPVPAHAHAHLKRSDPAAGSRLVAPPPAIRLWFSEAPEFGMTFALLHDSAGRMFALGPVQRESSGQMGVAFPVLSVLPPGRYTLAWRTAASDGHPSSGKFTFIVAALLPTAGVAQPPNPNVESGGTRDVPPVITHADSSLDAGRPGDADEASSIGNSLARAFLFVGLLALIGAVAFHSLVLGRASTLGVDLKQRMTQRAAMLGAASAVLVIGVGLLRAHLEVEMMTSMQDMPGMEGMSMRHMMMQSEWGNALWLQVGAAITALVGFALAMRRVRGGWALAGVSALVVAITPALGGHAAASQRFPSLLIAADWLHVLGGASWLGSLLCVTAIGVPIALTLPPPDKWRTVATLVNAFSPVALASAGVVVASGLFASWIHLDHLTALWQTSYGKVLLAKLLFVAITLGIGAYNFKRVQPQLANDVGTKRLRRSAVVELATGFMILLITGLLTGISP